MSDDLMRWPLANALGDKIADLLAGELAPIDVAVLDSGIDATHPDLSARVVKAYAPRLVDGKQVVEEHEPGPRDVFGHGTAVASVIAKIAKNARLIDYTVLKADNSGAGAALVAALGHAVEAKHRVINMSLAATAEFAPKLMPLCETAYRNGTVIVAAKRNMPLADLGFPAEFSSVISVDRGAFDVGHAVRYSPGKIIEFVGHGDEVVVAAPGGLYTTKTGTSFATPAVSAVVALLLGAHPDLRPFEVKSVLRRYSKE